MCSVGGLRLPGADGGGAPVPSDWLVVVVVVHTTRDLFSMLDSLLAVFFRHSRRSALPELDLL